MPKKRPLVITVEKSEEAKGYNSQRFIWENMNEAKSFLILPLFASGEKRGVAFLE